MGRNEKKIIIPTGYMGSGSSAITDLFSEIDDVNADKGTFEYVFLHCPNGVFDLEDKLLYGNNAIRSDEALHTFLSTMRQLYDKKYWWVGHYNKNIGLDFWKVTQKYIDELIEFRPHFYWYYQENVNAKMFFKLVRNKFIKLITLGKVITPKVVAYPEMWISFVTPEHFYKVSQRYIYEVMNMIGLEKESIVLDQLLLPFNLHRVSNYFKNDAEIFVVERDPRDVFISNKYYWSRNHEPVPYPTDVEDFCDYYKKMRKIEKPTQSSHVHKIKFEDLIYYYEDTVKKIFEELNWDESRHKKKKKKFNPDRSINNTQLFLKDEKYRKESMIIENELKEYLYEFPYSIEHSQKNVF